MLAYDAGGDEEVLNKRLPFRLSSDEGTERSRFRLLNESLREPGFGGRGDNSVGVSVCESMGDVPRSNEKSDWGIAFGGSDGKDLSRCMGD